MLRIIKSEAIIEEKSPVVLDLPAQVKAETFIVKDYFFDELDFFENLNEAAEEEDLDSKYYQNELAEFDPDFADQGHEKYFSQFEENLAEELEFEAFDLVQPPVQTVADPILETSSFNGAFAAVNGASEFSKFEQNLEDTSHLSILAVEKRIIREAEEQAEENARQIIEKANKEAANIRAKLMQEISDAEVRLEHAQKMAESIISEAEVKAEQIVAEKSLNAQAVLERAKTDGYAQGINKGTEEGYKKGFAEGRDEGSKAGSEEGYKKGFASGEEDGKKAGLEAARLEMQQALTESSQNAKAILIAAQQEKEQLINSADGQIIEIALAVARKIVGNTFKEDPFAILQIVKEAAQKVIDQPRLFITVCPENYELVKNSLNELKRFLGGKQEVSVVADASLNTADVIINTDGNGSVDARLEVQLSEIRKTIEAVIDQ